MAPPRLRIATLAAALGVAVAFYAPAVDDAHSLIAKPSPEPDPAAAAAPPPPHHISMADALAEGAANNNGNLSLPEGTLLPEVDCLVYLALKGSISLPMFEAQFRKLGFWDRVHVILSDPDPDGKAAGCFRSHIVGWKYALSKGCGHTLMLEEDVYFNEAVAHQALTTANNFLKSNTSYDLYMLGYTPQMNYTEGIVKPYFDTDYMVGSVTPTLIGLESEALQCVYNIHFWLCTQSYIISRPTMERWQHWTYIPGVTVPIDVLFAQQDLPTGGSFAEAAAGGDYPTSFRNRIYGGRPNIGFQRYHKPVVGQKGTQQTGSPMETFKMIPGVVYSIYDPELYGKAGITSPKACLPPEDAYDYTGLDTVAEGFKRLVPPFQDPHHHLFYPVLQKLRFSSHFLYPNGSVILNPDGSVPAVKVPSSPDPEAEPELP